MKQIFLISGKAESGKDTASNFLKEKLEGDTLVLHYADYLKLIARSYLGWNGEKDSKGRTLLQWLGTDRVRIELNKPLFWVERACDAIEIVEDKYDYFCISDCRFPNEVYYPKARFPGMVSSVRIIRNNYVSKLSKEQMLHPSEIALDDFVFDYTISSISGLEPLSNAIDNFIAEFEGKNNAR